MIYGADINPFELVGAVCAGLLVTALFLIATAVINLLHNPRDGEDE